MKEKIIIVGGVAGGATAAARARRLNEDAHIILFERGEFISFANCGLPYYIGGSIKNRDDLFITTPELFRGRYNIDIRTFTSVLSIDRGNKEIDVTDLKTGKTYKESYNKLILSPGAEPVLPTLEGLDLSQVFTLRTIPDTDRIMTFVETQKPKSAVIVGGGFIGVEMAENLTAKGVKTTLVEMLNQIMPQLDPEMASMLHEHLWENGVMLDLENRVTQIKTHEGRIRLFTENGYHLDTDMVIWAVGVKPENSLAEKAGLSLGVRSGIEVNAAMKTTDPDIFAVGDAVINRHMISGKEILLPLAGPANKQARIAADNALGRSSIFHGVLGTSIVKVFKKTAAITGLTERNLKAENMAYIRSYTFSGSHASYFPGSETMGIKLLFTPGAGKILGAQIVGGEGVDKRIDILSTAIYAGLTVHDLERLELAYAPPYSAAKDPINIAGFVAANILKGDIEVIHWDEIDAIDPTKTILIDLRTQQEIDMEGTIEGAIHIPIEQLREKLGELDREKSYAVFCAIGLRGYLGYRIMSQKGFNVKSLNGGFEIYKTTLPV